ncbi:MAG: hypothetical protein NT178_16650 [Proteobacteria bacterium]|nr:hypothetical protein [Pseudomonadota bacterium]
MTNKLSAIILIAITAATLGACNLEVHDPQTARLIQLSVTTQQSGNNILLVILIVVTIVAGFIGLGWWQTRPKEDNVIKPTEQK